MPDSPHRRRRSSFARRGRRASSAHRRSSGAAPSRLTSKLSVQLRKLATEPSLQPRNDHGRASPPSSSARVGSVNRISRRHAVITRRPGDPASWRASCCRAPGERLSKADASLSPGDDPQRSQIIAKGGETRRRPRGAPTPLRAAVIDAILRVDPHALEMAEAP